MAVNWDLIVLGAGYWGTAISLEAKRIGWNTLVIDDADPKSGSRNASAICDPKAYRSPIFQKLWPSDWTDSDLKESLCWLVSHGAVQTQEYFWNTFLGSEPREAGQALYLPSPDALTSLARPYLRARLSLAVVGTSISLRTEVGPGKVGLYRRPGDVTCKRLAVACGYRTDEVLGMLGLPYLGITKLYGRGINASGNPSPSVSGLPVSVMIKPYTKHTVRKWRDGTWRVGDTAENVPNERQLGNLRQVGALALSSFRELEVVEGFRPVLPRFTVEKLGSNVVVASGGHRLGLGLSGLVAKKVVEMLR